MDFDEPNVVKSFQFLSLKHLRSGGQKRRNHIITIQTSLNFTQLNDSNFIFESLNSGISTTCYANHRLLRLLTAQQCQRNKQTETKTYGQMGEACPECVDRLNCLNQTWTAFDNNIYFLSLQNMHIVTHLVCLILLAAIDSTPLLLFSWRISGNSPPSDDVCGIYTTPIIIIINRGQPHNRYTRREAGRDRDRERAWRKVCVKMKMEMKFLVMKYGHLAKLLVDKTMGAKARGTN